MPRNYATTWLFISAVILWSGLFAPEPRPAFLLQAAPIPIGQPITPEGKIAARPGVVVESVGRGSALEKAGLQAGDIIYRWHRLPKAPANSGDVRGEFNSPFDWWSVEVEQAQRGPLLLSGTRSGEDLTLMVEWGEWRTKVRPQLSPQSLGIYMEISGALLKEDTARVLSLWKVLEHKPNKLIDPTERAWLSYWLAGELLNQGRSEEPLALVTRALQPGQDRQTQAPLLMLAGDIHEQQGALEKAEEAFLETLQARTNALGPSLGEAAVHSRLGTFYLYQGQMDKAEKHYRASFDIREKMAPGSMDFASSMNNMGVLALEVENFDLALSYFSKALELRSALAPGSSAEGESFYNVGIVYGRTHAEDSSERSFRRALEAFNEVDPKSLRVAMTLNCLGVTYLDRQDLELARFYFDQALGILREVAPEGLDVADALTNLGQIFYQERSLDKAERHFSEALRIQRKVAPGGRALANNLNNLGMTLGERGEFARSLEAHREALRVLGRIAPQGAEVASNLYNIGVLYSERQNYRKGGEFLNQSLALRERLIPDSYILAETYGALGKMARDMGALPTAETWYSKAIQTFERQTLFLGSARVGTVPLRSSREAIYRGAISVATKRGDAKAVFELLEKHRGLQLAEMIARREDSVLGQLPDSVSAQLKELQASYEEVSGNLELLTGKDVEQESGALISQLSEIQRRYSEVIESARASSGRTLEYRYPRSVRAAELASMMLGHNQGLLYFFIVDEEVWSLVVLDDIRMYLRRHSLRTTELKGKIERLRSHIKSGRTSVALEASEKLVQERLARELYNVLIWPVETSFSNLARLLIIPDGPLHLLPWGYLIRGYPDREGEAQYLAEWKPFHLVLSGTVYSELQTSRPHPDVSNVGSTLVAFADPEYPVEDMDGTSQGVADLRSRSSMLRRYHSGWERLLFSRQEVEGIARLFQSDRSQLFFGGEATEERAKSIGDSTRIIHFATHAYLDDRFPLNSALVLSRPQGLPESRENGLLQVWEIFERIHWHADLVVLSGCETALGQEQGGEGLLGLTRAFQYAGARSVLASLWNVNDQATSELMIRFYRHFRTGMSKDQALKAAQQELIRGPIEVVNEKGERVLKDFSAPYYWAGFQLYGDWR